MVLRSVDRLSASNIYHPNVPVAAAEIPTFGGRVGQGAPVRRPRGVVFYTDGSGHLDGICEANDRFSGLAKKICHGRCENQDQYQYRGRDEPRLPLGVLAGRSAFKNLTGVDILLQLLQLVPNVLGRLITTLGPSE